MNQRALISAWQVAVVRFLRRADLVSHSQDTRDAKLWNWWSRNCAELRSFSLLWAPVVKTVPLSRVNRQEVASDPSIVTVMNIFADQDDYEDGTFSDPVLMYEEGDPRIIDTIFNVSSLTTSGIFNNTLFQTAGIIILGIILFGEFNETTNQVFTFSTTGAQPRGKSIH